MVPAAAIWLLRIPFYMFTPAVMTASALEVMMLSLALSVRLARLQQDNVEARLSGEKARLELLRYQLNPHFFFNALNSIYGLVFAHSREAGDMVLRLSSFCRSIFAYDGDALRTLGEELAMVRSYLDIEQVRWRERLLVEYHLDPRFNNVQLPPFLLLPLAENAIKHRGATSSDLLKVRVTTRPCGQNAFEIVIANTGALAGPRRASHRVINRCGLGESPTSLGAQPTRQTPIGNVAFGWLGYS